jgi:hypothetical protein
MHSSNSISQLRIQIRNLAEEGILRPAQNFTSRISRRDAEICTRVKGDFKTVALALLGIRLLLLEENEIEDLSFWSILSNLLEYSPTFTLLQNAKIQSIFALEEDVLWENILEENYFGRTLHEIFGYILDKQRKKDLEECYHLYLKTPKTPKRIQRHRGYRDKGSLPGDKAYLDSRNFEQDSHQQILREQYKSYQYTFQELKELYGGRAP